MKTIGTHNGHTFSQGHNRREYNEPHIDPNGLHETWKDEDLETAYHELFDDALAKYNSKQTRKDRQISNYYEHIKKKKNQYPAYEMIVGIYTKDEELSLKERREILKKFVDTWQERNPNLRMVGAYFHADEQGQPHVHIDYIPVAHNCKRGLETQCNLKKGLAEMGMVTAKNRGTAQMQMQRKNNQYLEELCRERGYVISHPGGSNLPKEAFIAKQELEKTKAEQAREDIEFYKNARLAVDTATAVKSLQEREKTLAEKADAYAKSITSLVEKREALTTEIADLQAQKKRLPQVKNELKSLETRERKLKSSVKTLQAQESQLQQQVDKLKDTRDFYFLYDALLEIVNLLLKILEKLLDRAKYKEVLHELGSYVESACNGLYAGTYSQQRRAEALQQVLEESGLQEEMERNHDRWHDGYEWQGRSSR